MRLLLQAYLSCNDYANIYEVLLLKSLKATTAQKTNKYKNKNKDTWWIDETSCKLQ